MKLLDEGLLLRLAELISAVDLDTREAKLVNPLEQRVNADVAGAQERGEKKQENRRRPI